MWTRRRCLVSALGAAAALAARPATAQDVRPILRGVTDPGVNALQYGVRPDSAQDQGAAITRALRLATAAGRPLFLPPGRYVVSDLAVPAGAQLNGAGPATRLVHRGGGGFVRLERATGARLTNFALDGGGRAFGAGARGLITIIESAGVALDGLTLSGSPASGVILERSGGAIRSVRIDGVADAGLFARDSTGLEITDNTITRVGNNGIQVWRTAQGRDGTLVARNTIEAVRWDAGGNGQNGNGINVFRAGGVRIEDNALADCAFSAIRNNAGADCHIRRNTARRLGEVAIFAEFEFRNAVIVDNDIDTAAAGISATNFDHGGRGAIIRGNTVRNLTARSAVNPDTTPYGIAAEADALIEGNSVMGSPGVGLQIGWGPYLANVTAQGNRLSDCAVAISVSVVDRAGAARVIGNAVSGASRAALVGSEWHRIVTRDFGREREGRHRNLAYARNSVA